MRYDDAGVSIDAAARCLKRLAEMYPEGRRFVGPFAAALEIGALGAGDTLVLSADGVGTKLALARRLGALGGVGQDLVAMCVNDVVCRNARPALFMDYFATGKLDEAEFESVMRGVVTALREVGCTLVGGETAELPGLVAGTDVAGFCVGVAFAAEMPDPARVSPGCKVVGLPSNGFHSNGYSLVRRVVESAGLDLAEPLGDRTLGEALLAPTTLYVGAALRAFKEFGALGAAHVTGGGLPGNLVRALPAGLGVRLDAGAWRVPPVIERITAAGGIPLGEARRVFNMGLGFCIVSPPERAEETARTLGGAVVGEVVEGAGVAFAG